MELPVSQQGVQLLLSAALGAGLGVVYSLLRALRLWARRGAVTAASDAAFWLLTGAALFLFGLLPGRGELRLFMLAGAAAGASVWLLLAGRAVTKACVRLLETFAHAGRRALRPVRRTCGRASDRTKKLLKKLFKNVWKWFTINQIGARRIAAQEEGAEFEAQAGKYFYEDRHCSSGGLRLRQSDPHPGTDYRGASGAGDRAAAGDRSDAGKRRNLLRHRARRG